MFNRNDYCRDHFEGSRAEMPDIKASFLGLLGLIFRNYTLANTHPTSSSKPRKKHSCRAKRLPRISRDRGGCIGKWCAMQACASDKLDKLKVISLIL